MFLERIDKIFSENCWASMAAFDELATRTEVMRQVALDIAREALVPGPSHVPHWRRHWLSAARAAWGRASVTDVLRCVARIPEDRSLFLHADGTLCGYVSEGALADRLSQENRAAVAEDLVRELAGAQGDEAKSAVKARAHRRLASWSPTRRRLVTQIVLDPDGNAALDEREDLMFEHWGPIFSADGPTDDDATRWLLEHVPRWAGEIALPDFDSFARMVHSTAASAPGPDVLSYAYWSTHSDNVKALYSCLEAIWSGAEPPAWFNEATVIFIPKSTAAPAESSCRAPPARYCPLTLANSSQKLIAKAINGILEPIVVETVSPHAERICEGTTTPR